MNEPNNWLVLKIEKEDDIVYKVFASWFGGYTDGDVWKMNSGITKVELIDGNYLFYGASGSCYTCHEKSYGHGTSYHRGILAKLMNAATSTGYTIDILDEDTNWSELLNEEI